MLPFKLVYHERYDLNLGEHVFPSQKYRLVREDQHGYAVTICYVGGDESRLAPLVGERLTVHGREKMIQGVRHPLLVPERIEREAR